MASKCIAKCESRNRYRYSIILCSEGEKAIGDAAAAAAKTVGDVAAAPKEAVQEVLKRADD